MSSVAPIHGNGAIKWTNVPRQPIPPLDDVSLWVGHQLNHKRMPKEYKHMPPDGELMVSLDGYPEGLLAIPNDDGSPRIIVPRNQIKSLDSRNPPVKRDLVGLMFCFIIAAKEHEFQIYYLTQVVV